MPHSIQEALVDINFVTDKAAKIQLDIFTLIHERNRVKLQLMDTPKIFKTKKIRINLDKRINNLTNRINTFIKMIKKEKILYGNNLC